MGKSVLYFLDSFIRLKIDYQNAKYLMAKFESHFKLYKGVVE